MEIAAIAAMASNRVIGVDNKLPWHIPEDLKYFRLKTKNKILIMGRKTFDSVGSKPMKSRLTVVITRQKNYTNPNCFVLSVNDSFEHLKKSNFDDSKAYAFHTIDDAINFCKMVSSVTDKWGQEIMVCGGEEIYRLAMPYTDVIYLTVIDQDYPGDAKFPEFDTNVYQLIDKQQFTEPVSFSFCTFKK